MAEVSNLFIAVRLLLAEIIGWEAQHDQSLCFETFVKPFQAIVLSGKTTVTGRVNHQNDFSAVLAERLGRLILQAFKRLVEQLRAAACSH